MKPLAHCLLVTVESDSHMWNLVYLQLWLAEQGMSVTNLGSCTPVEAVLTALEQQRSQLLVVSSVNGHGYSQGLQLIRQVRKRHPHLHCVIGGKLTTCEAQTLAAQQDLLDAGYNQVFVDAHALNAFRHYLATLQPQAEYAITPADSQVSWG
ncbi:cobalamin B12-binding domain-containing protein [Pseudomonas sp. 5P_3.1_Bac2]|uniref:cobalamin B12-binding domain-containing protein n=1 Tax=Pseudomonas sp. 5P_3.1_Bac2 TaxID=2971617 RepID=UPI0021C6CAD2|nr:cobalamin B12-binding domain-containing protein [Pseudomonas sp. 5P_3.1_Bac2]MCU1719026.1 cobalamin-dependent protein [Pseudomonas sp. 5P_3.1_Bac2]